MGALTEGQMLTQLKKAQGETNDRLDAILSELRLIRQALAPGTRPAAPASNETMDQPGGSAWTRPVVRRRR